MIKDNLISNLHTLHRKDPLINELFKSTGSTLDNINNDIEDVKKQYWFDTMTWAIPLLEGILQFKTDPTKAVENRRSQLEARWKSDSKVDVYLLKAIANSWRNGDIDVRFVNGKIQITFTGEHGLPNDLDGIYQAIEDVKPAHIPVDYELVSITKMNLYFGATTLGGETITVYPWSNREIQTTGIINIGSLSAINAEITTVYPKEAS